MMFGTVPDIAHLRVIGSKAFLHLHKCQQENSFATRAHDGILIGYARETKGYRILQTNSHRIVETVRVTFAECLGEEPNTLITNEASTTEQFYGGYPIYDIDPPIQLPPDVAPDHIIE